ncbi:MAG TPA: ribosome maturation factor RimM [Actinomycetota bacterium]|nr:ribosome maturation factor RimM [Actinomycetota bacterium]
MSREDLAVGRVARAHGIRGEVSVESLSEVEGRYAPGSVLRLDDGRVLTVTSVRTHGHRLLVRFEEVVDRTAAEALRGQVLLVAAADVPPIEEEGRFWVHEVVGLEAVTEEGRSLGRIRDVLHNPANDLWVAEGASGEALIPAVRDVVVAVDRAAGRVVVRELPGLFPEG